MTSDNQLAIDCEDGEYRVYIVMSVMIYVLSNFIKII